MCLSNSDLLSSARRFEKLHYIIYWIYIYFFFYLFIPKTQAENFLSLYGNLHEDGKKNLHFWIVCPDFLFFMGIGMKKYTHKTCTEVI